MAITEIPGVVAAGVTWQLAWQGTDNADGLVGTADAGLLFAQEQPSRVSKLDKNERRVGLPDGHSWRRFGGDRLQGADSRRGENIYRSWQTGGRSALRRADGGERARPRTKSPGG